MTENIDDEVMYVINRRGKREILDTNQIVHRIRSLANREPKLPHVNAHTLMLSIMPSLKSDITTSQIDDFVALSSASLSTKNPYYLEIAARLAIDNHQKNTLRCFYDKMKMLYLNKENDISYPLLSPEFFKYVEENIDYIESLLDYNKDFMYSYFGFCTFLSMYSLKIKGVPVERPQDMIMRVSIAVSYMQNISPEDKLKNIKLTYEMMSRHEYTHASPTLFNSGTNINQPASCFLTSCEDSQHGIMKLAMDISAISKSGGGIGADIHSIRSEGSVIRSTGGISKGIVPFVQIFNQTIKAFNQGGRRKGAMAVYCMMHHPDIENFIMLGSHTGKEHERARDLFYAVWVPDIFMERLKNNSVWSMFDPDICGDLSNYHNEEYNKRYLELEKDKRYSKQVPARTLWKMIYDVNKEIGHPYVCFSDTVNRMSQYANIGTIRSSNLCSEIMLYSDTQQYAVCILSSISLPSFVFDKQNKSNEFPIEPWFNFANLQKCVERIVINLNSIVDSSSHPTIESCLGNWLHRPIGVGVQGLDDCFAKMRYPFDSEEAARLNKMIFETIYYAATTASAKLSRDRYLRIQKCLLDTGIYEQYVPEMIKDHPLVKQCRKVIDSVLPYNVAAYPSMQLNGGSPISRGVFHWELAGLKESDLHCGYDWQSTRELILKFGVCNVVTTTCMPTASTSQLLGNCESIECATSNFYTRKTQSGSFICFKKYLINYLYTHFNYDENLRTYLLKSEGSIQNIDGIPDEVKKLFRTVWEYDPAVFVQLAVDRQPFIDQAQSLNWYVPNITLAQWNRLMEIAHTGGLKTAKYYLRSKPEVRPTLFTVSPNASDNYTIIKGTSDYTSEGCLACGS